MAEAMPKQYLPLAGVSVLHRALAPLEAEPRITGIVLVVAPDDPFGNDYRPLTSKPLIVGLRTATLELTRNRRTPWRPEDTG